MEILVLGLKMTHTTRGILQLFALHGELDILLTAFDAEGVHLTVHEQVKHHSTYRYTYYNI